MGRSDSVSGRISVRGSDNIGDNVRAIVHARANVAVVGTIGACDPSRTTRSCARADTTVSSADVAVAERLGERGRFGDGCLTDEVTTHVRSAVISDLRSILKQLQR
jgi:hypothetical protein